MIKILLNIIFFATIINASIIKDKVKNIIGKTEYNHHKNLINMLFDDNSKFIVNNKIRYNHLLKELQKNGLLKLKFDKPTEIVLKFTIKNNNKSIRAFKIINDTMQAMGYRYFFTKTMNVDSKNTLTWEVRFKAEYMTDPVVFIEELYKNNCKVINIENIKSNNWLYELDFSQASLNSALKVEKYEKLKFTKPLRAILLKVNNAKRLSATSRHLNRWFPHIVFFNKDLTILGIVKKDKVHRNLTTLVPHNTKYIKITDMYNLINIKRGLTIIVR